VRQLGVTVVLLSVLAGGVTAQTSTTTTTTPSTNGPQAATPSGPTALPYKDEEFPAWALKLRRFEIIAVGAFPIVFMFTGVGYDYAYYASTGFSQTYIPWPAGQGTSQWTTTNNPTLLQNKNITIVAVSIGLSLAVAGVDWLLGLK